MTEKDIKKALKHGERLTLEVKRAKSDIPKSVWESYSAFANTIGGLIVLGIGEDRNQTNLTKRFTIAGVDNPVKIISDFWNTINSDKVSQNILLNDNVEALEVDGKQIVCIHVTAF